MHLAAVINQSRWEKHIRDEQHREKKPTNENKIPKEGYLRGLR